MWTIEYGSIRRRVGEWMKQPAGTGADRTNDTNLQRGG